MRDGSSHCRDARRNGGLRGATAAAALLTLLLLGTAASLPAQLPHGGNQPGVLEPVLSAITGQDIRIPNTDQSVDGNEQSLVHGDIVYENAYDGTALSMLGHPITRVSSPNDDMRLALHDMATAADADDTAALQAAAEELMSILLGTTQGRIYDGFSMLNFNRFKDPDIGPESFPPDVMPGEYKMKLAHDTGETFVSPFDGEVRKIWECNVNLLYYDGQIDSDTFLVRFPFGHNDDDTLRVHYRIFSTVREDFSPTLVMLDKRKQASTVQFPFKGFDAVWIGFEPGEVLNVSVDYPPVRIIRGIYTWGWRVHPPRIQFVQPIYEIKNQVTGAIELDPQGKSFAFRNREDLTIDTISDAAPEKKMYTVAKAVLDGMDAATVEKWLTDPNLGPRGTWFEWADLAQEQRQLPPEAWDILEQEGLSPGDFGPYQMVSVYMNNEMYGDGPFLNEIKIWDQGQRFKIKLINLDKHTHYFRNVDFGPRLSDDILRCCGGGETSFEIMNFKGTYGIPKVAEAQWRAGWGFRPHFNIIQQQDVFSRAVDRVKLKPYTGGFGDIHYGYQWSEAARGGDFRFNPPPFVITDAASPAPLPLKDSDGQPGLVLGQLTEGTGTAEMCPEDPFPGFCTRNIAEFNPNGALNWPPPPLQGVNGNPDHPTELRFPPFLRNPSQGNPAAGDIIPPTGAWKPFLFINPNNGSLFIDPNDPSKGYWVDLTYSHGRPIFAGQAATANIEALRSSAQVFYQFDDLFHDNDIFSPHPVFTGFGHLDTTDTVARASAMDRAGSLRVVGTLTPLGTLGFAGWVTLFDGPAGADGCSGTPIAYAPVSSQRGRFVLRTSAGDLHSGSTVCVQSIIGGFSEVVVK